jgi:AcrR family transcriptional regulator
LSTKVDRFTVKRTTPLTVPSPGIREVGWVAGPRTDKTKNLIITTANRLFLERGYSVVRVEDIASAAQISRSLFYVYFPSKRDVFLAIGVGSIMAGKGIVDALGEVSPLHTEAEMAGWIDAYLDYLEHFGAFIRSWDDAMATDSELQRQSYLNVQRFCRRLGLQLERLRGYALGDATVQGLALRALIEGVWYFWRVSDLPHEREEIVDTLTKLVENHIGLSAAPAPAPAPARVSAKPGRRSNGSSLQ